MTDQTSPLTEQQLDEYATLAVIADHEGRQIDAAVVTALVDEVRRLQQQRQFLLRQLAKKDAASGAGDRAVAEFLGSASSPPTSA